MSSSSSYSSLLSSKQRIERDKGLEIVKELFKDPNDEIIAGLEKTVLTFLTEDNWESIHGALLAGGYVIEAGLGSRELCTKMQTALPTLLEHDEPRIRLSAGEMMGHLCSHSGSQVYTDLQDVLLDGIRSHLDRDTGMSESGDQMETHMDTDDRVGSPVPALIFHDTAGWKALETYMIALQKATTGCGEAFAPFVTSDLLQLIFASLGHTNRFVRETGYRTLAAIVKCPALPDSIISFLWPSIADHLAIGLADNWSQVRMSASVATREFLTTRGSPDHALQGLTYLPVLLPPMCLNRYYVAEGVKLYSQETWKLVTDGRGVELVEENLEKTVEFYVSQSQASNHAVREAACACIAELGAKMSRDSLRIFVMQLISVLLECFKDDSWPVRDAACLASGNFVLCFPEECKASLDELFPLFLANLEDSIPSVRQGAAEALAQLVTAYGAEVEERIFTTIRERLPQVSTQSNSTPSSVDPSPAVFGVVRRIESGESGADSSHTDQQMYSCGSLAPKMKRGGCMDSAFHRPPQPWERSEGCIHLLAALSQNPSLTRRVESFLPTLAEASRVRHYTQHLAYLETLLKQLPVISKSLGKRLFKQYLELFLDTIFYALSCDSPLVKAAGVQCLRMLTQQIGRMVMRGRIEQQNSRYASIFDRTIV